jgi:hypothetical protein
VRHPLFGFALFFVSILPLSGDSIDVSSDSLVTLQNNNSLIFDLGMWNYAEQASNDGLASPYPAEISVMLAGLPVDAATSPISGTSAVYTPGILFSGDLESVDGSVVIPLVDCNAALLGLPTGDMVLTNGYTSGSSYSGPISLLTASVVLSSAEAADLFAAGSLDPWSESFVLRLNNIGGNITFGYPGASIEDASSASLSSADGTLSVGAVPLQADLRATPEPGSVGLLLIGLAVIAAITARSRG